MNCREYAELLSGMLDGELTAEELRQIKTHLSCCPFCQEQYQEMEMVQQLLQEAFRHDPSFSSLSILERVRLRIKEKGYTQEIAQNRFWPRFGTQRLRYPAFPWLRPAYGLLFALLLLMALGGYYAFWYHTQPPLKDVYQLPTTPYTARFSGEERFKRFLYLQRHALSVAENPLFTNTGTLEYANQFALAPR